MNAQIEQLWESLRDRYSVEGEVGAGGMANVYRARDLKHDRDVAIKVLRPDLSAAIGGERFLREIKIASRLQHPHILPLYDSGDVNGTLYYVMPFIDGESLRDRLAREKQMSLDQSLRIVDEVAGALHYAHDQGVIHRDIKPGNVLLTSDHAIISDFGIAQALAEAGGEKLTQSGIAIGTPTYMSPEQGGGEDVDGRSDLYSLACVLFEMLAGDPPFSGRTAQAILARHMLEAPPSMEVVRPETPAGVVDAIETALAKIPAERFDTPVEFATALRGEYTGARRHSPYRRKQKGKIAAAAAVVAVLTASATWAITRPTAPELDLNSVMVYPLAASGFADEDPGGDDVGTEVAIAIQQGMIYADPLKALEGQLYLDPSTEAGPAVATMADVSRAKGAGYFISGAVRAHEDSVTVSLRLYSTADGEIASERATGQATEAELVGLQAFGKLLDDWVDPGRDVSLAPLLERRPAALALWVQGEKAFRLSNPESALDFYHRAIEEDSALALAAVKGALASNWEHEMLGARELVGIGLSHDSLLPPRYADFARGLEAYLYGQADSAVVWLERSVADDPEWAEAYALLGETYFHFLPSRRSLDSLAETNFERALALDSAFSPPLYHLIQVAARRGELERGATLLDRYQRIRPDTTLSRELDWLVRCASGDFTASQWQAAAEADPQTTLSAASVFSAGMANPSCAAEAFGAVLHSDSSMQEHRQGALTGLQSVLVAQGRVEAAVALIDSALAANDRQQMSLFVIDALADIPVEERAEWADDWARQETGDNYEALSASSWRWVFGAWSARQGQLERVKAVRDALRQSATDYGDRQSIMFARAMDAHVTLLEGDTLGAISTLREVDPTAASDELPWLAWESLPYERLLLARLLFSQAQYEDAYHVAAGFDHPEPAIYAAFVPESLQLRKEAAERLGWADSADVHRERLLELGRADLIGSRP